MQFTVHCTQTGRVVSNSLVAVLLISEMHRDCMVYSFSYQTKYLLKVNPLNAELHPICHLLALLGAHHIFHVSGLRVNATYCKHFKELLDNISIGIWTTLASSVLPVH